MTMSIFRVLLMLCIDSWTPWMKDWAFIQWSLGARVAVLRGQKDPSRSTLLRCNYAMYLPTPVLFAIGVYFNVDRS